MKLFIKKNYNNNFFWNFFLLKFFYFQKKLFLRNKDSKMIIQRILITNLNILL
jgi:hypothetical protein